MKTVPFWSALLLCCWGCSAPAVEPLPPPDPAEALCIWTPIPYRAPTPDEYSSFPHKERQLSPQTLAHADSIVVALDDEADWENNYYADTLLDVNGDGWEDLLLESYGQSGHGFKHLHTVFLFDSTIRRYTPAFVNWLNVGLQLDEGTFTSTYYGYEHTTGETYRWEGLSFILVETVERRYSYDTDTAYCEQHDHRLQTAIASRTCSFCMPPEYDDWIELEH